MLNRYRHETLRTSDLFSPQIDSFQENFQSLPTHLQLRIIYQLYHDIFLEPMGEGTESVNDGKFREEDTFKTIKSFVDGVAAQAGIKPPLTDNTENMKVLCQQIEHEVLADNASLPQKVNAFIKVIFWWCDSLAEEKRITFDDMQTLFAQRAFIPAHYASR